MRTLKTVPIGNYNLQFIDIGMNIVSISFHRQGYPFKYPQDQLKKYNDKIEVSWPDFFKQVKEAILNFDIPDGYKLAIGSFDPKKTRAYKKILTKLGFRLEFLAETSEMANLEVYEIKL